MSQAINQIPFVDLVTQSNELATEVLEAIETVIRRAAFILGDEVQEFEEQFADFCGVAHCVSVASGTDALHMSLRALDIGPGDEVITAANTFAATPLAVAHAGAKPVFVDANEGYNMDPDALADAITPQTKAIIPVHLYGHPADMDPILEIAAQHGLRIVEDTAQAHGATYNGQLAGTFGDFGCFSFYPGKNLGAFGDGGAVVTNDADLAERLRLLRNYGQRVKNVHSLVGFNSRLDTVQAAVLLVKLRYLDDWNDQRRAAAGWYNKFLTEKEAPVVVPREESNAKHVYHLYVVQHENRDGLIHGLRERGIQCGVHYPHAISHAEPFRDSKSYPAGAPVATRMASRIVSLPMYPGLTEADTEAVADAIVEVSARL